MKWKFLNISGTFRRKKLAVENRFFNAIKLLIRKGVANLNANLLLQSKCCCISKCIRFIQYNRSGISILNANNLKNKKFKKQTL